MAKTIRRKLLIARTGQEPFELKIFLRNTRRGWVCGPRRELEATLAQLISWGRMWYLPEVDAFAFRVLVEPATNKGREVWLLMNGPFGWRGGVAMVPEAFVRDIETRRSSFQASDFFGAQIPYFIAKMKRTNSSWLLLPHLEAVMAACSREPFHTAISDLRATLEEDTSMRREDPARVWVSKVNVRFHDGSYIDFGPEETLFSNKMVSEVNDVGGGRTLVIHDWAGDFGHA